MFLGIDIGTSSVKALLVDGEQKVVAGHDVILSLQRPKPNFSEQDPEAWVNAVIAAIDALKGSNPREIAAIEAIGLSGQMHGAVLLGNEQKPLRPAILWNDGRAHTECIELEAKWPQSRSVTGNKAMSGFTAPKLLWVAKHEPEIFAATRLVLLPKAYIRLVLTGEAIEEMSDAAGSLWLDVGERDWSDTALSVTGLSRQMMPRLVEGSAPAGRLRAEFVARWGMSKAPIFAGGAGDNAAGAIGLGAIHPGSSFLSLGTSGVLWVTTDRFMPNPGRAVHAFCHAVPQTWHQMGVILSAAASLAWIAGVLQVKEPALLAALGNKPIAPSSVQFLPYLSGERTPHDDTRLRGAFVGLSHESHCEAMVQAVLEGVAFAFADCRDALTESGSVIAEADVIGGGSRSHFWIEVLANVLGFPLHRLAEGETGGAFGAARLARLAATSEDPGLVCNPAKRVETIEPDPGLARAYEEALARWRRLYPTCQPS